ncbi:MAG: hypothetical protein JW768_01620 [Chitinispirillaceae bacterium]|nr:hypothetical protein [Chitinispirillaceae bacterium]
MSKSLIRTSSAIVLVPGMVAPLLANQSIEAHVVMGLVAMVSLLIINLAISILGRAIPHNARSGFALLLVAGIVTLAAIVCSPLLLTHRLPCETLAPLLCCAALCALHTEAYAVRHSIRAAFLDALALGLSFSLLLCAAGIIRDILGKNLFLSMPCMTGYAPAAFFLSVPGIFIIVAGAGALMTLLSLRTKRSIS